MSKDNRGWYKESKRHSLASRGIKTNADCATPITIVGDNNQTPKKEIIMYHGTIKKYLPKIIKHGLSDQYVSSEPTVAKFFSGYSAGGHIYGDERMPIVLEVSVDPDNLYWSDKERNIISKLESDDDLDEEFRPGKMGNQYLIHKGTISPKNIRIVSVDIDDYGYVEFNDMVKEKQKMLGSEL